MSNTQSVITSDAFLASHQTVTNSDGKEDMHIKENSSSNALV